MLTKEASSVHLMYMTSIILAGYAIYKLIDHKILTSVEIFGVALIIAIAAFLSDRVIERFDYDQVRQLGDENIKKHWEEFVSHRR